MDSSNGAGSRVWFVTGSSSGLGLAVCQAALAAGDTVVATARQPRLLDRLVTTVPNRVTALPLDVTDHGMVSDSVRAALDRHGKIDVLVNNAGAGLLGAVEENTDEELRALFDLNLFAPAALVREVLPHMRARGSGTIVQMSSMGGQITRPGVSAYCATKWALEAISETLADEVRPFGIRVLVVEPGQFRTNFAGQALRESQELTAYRDILRPYREGMRSGYGNEPGDPVKAAEAIVAAVGDPDAPLRLALGDDAVDSIREHHNQLLADMVRVESTSRSTAFSRESI